MPAEARKVWLPESYHDKKISSVQRALTQYDELLRFGRNEDTGQWCVFRLMPRNSDNIPELWPIIGWDEIPEAEFVMHKVQDADLMRNGDAILREIERKNAARSKRMEDAAQEGAGEAAEALESFLHAQGKTGYHRSLRKLDPKQRTGVTTRER